MTLFRNTMSYCTAKCNGVFKNGVITNTLQAHSTFIDWGFEFNSPTLFPNSVGLFKRAFDARTGVYPGSKMVLLKFLGTSGSGSNQNKIVLANHFGGIGHGTIRLYKRRAAKAILSLFLDAVHWPDEEERKQIAKCIEEHFCFPNCIGIADGTLLPLAFKHTLFGEAYLTRKSNYAVHMLVICDDQCRIPFFNAGWPGSVVHDNRMWQLSDLVLRNADVFSGIQCDYDPSVQENCNAWYYAPGA
jgi:hypothetical protein